MRKENWLINVGWQIMKLYINGHKLSISSTVSTKFKHQNKLSVIVKLGKTAGNQINWVLIVKKIEKKHVKTYRITNAETHQLLVITKQKSNRAEM